jgi:hypothetical protein
VRAINEGRLEGAIADDGDIDPVLADAAWARNSREDRTKKPNGHDRSPTLAASRRRKMGVSVQVLEGEVEALRRDCIRPLDAQRITREELGPVVERLRAIPPRVEGLAASVRLALEELAAVHHPVEVTTPRPRPVVETILALESWKNDLLSEHAEFLDGLRRGTLIRCVDVIAEIEWRLTAARTSLLNMPASAATDDQVAPELELVIRELTGRVDPIELPDGEFRIPEMSHTPPRPIKLVKPKASPAKKVKRNGGPTIHALTEEFNRLAEGAQRLGITWAKHHTSDFGTRAAAEQQLARLKREIGERT